MESTTPELHQKYRPRSLERVVGATQTVAALRGMLDAKSLPHAILLSGPSGCGKTTIARILKEEMGCHDLDYKETNSGSFKGIDSIREVQRMMNLMPMGGIGCRMWLFDECHKWTNDAQNASLKMLEDCPPHVYFILATTDPQKLIKPVLGRCTEMPVRLLTHDELKGLLTRVCKKEALQLRPDFEEELLSSAQGSARNLLVLLNKAMYLPDDERMKAIQDKLAADNEAIDLCRALIAKAKWDKVAGILRNLKGEPETTRWSVLMYAKAVLLSKGDHQAYLIIDIFKNHFYESKEAGLAAACFEVCHSK